MAKLSNIAQKVLYAGNAGEARYRGKSVEVSGPQKHYPQIRYKSPVGEYALFKVTAKTMNSLAKKGLIAFTDGHGGPHPWLTPGKVQTYDSDFAYKLTAKGKAAAPSSEPAVAYYLGVSKKKKKGLKPVPSGIMGMLQSITGKSGLSVYSLGSSKSASPVGIKPGDYVNVKAVGGKDHALAKGTDSKGRMRYQLHPPKGKTAREVAREIKKSYQAGKGAFGGKIYVIRIVSGGKEYNYYKA